MNAPQMDRQTFLAHLRQSGLLTAEELAEALQDLPDSSRGRMVARALVEKGVLTKFQAELLLAGRTSGFVLGQYRILDQLGRGGMGRVFKAEHQTMNRVVALKVLAGHLVKTPKAQQMFQREVRAAARLVHPNIVTAYDANQIGDRHYLVMEFVDGPNLDLMVREQGPLPIGQASDFIRQTANGLQYAHEHGMVHRDIKPANLLVQRSIDRAGNHRFVVKVLDFGLARLHTRSPNDRSGNDSILAANNTVMGTPDFLSPEQARNLHEVDIRSDLYSLGCTFYFLLTGSVPYPGGSMLEKLVRHNTEDPAPVERIRPDVPAAVGAIVRRLMEKEPSARFQTPAEVAAALAPFAVQDAVPLAAPVAATAGAVSPVAPVSLPPTKPRSPVAKAPESSPASWDDGEVAVGILPTDLGDTPVSATNMPSVQLRRAVDLEQRRRLKIAVIAAIGIVAVLMVLASLALLMR